MKANKKTYINIANLSTFPSNIVNQHESHKKEEKKSFSGR